MKDMCGNYVTIDGKKISKTGGGGSWNTRALYSTMILQGEDSFQGTRKFDDWPLSEIGLSTDWFKLSLEWILSFRRRR